MGVTRLEPVGDPGPSRELVLPGAPTVRGDGDHSYACGWCGAVLFAHLDEPYAVRSVAVRCPVCERHSRAPAP